MERRLSTILIAAAVAGTLQLGIAFLLAAASGRGILPVLREMAAGMLGEGMRARGWGGAVIGLALHFVMIAVVVLVYSIAARRIALLRAHKVFGGGAFGLLLGATHWLLAPRGLPTLFPQVTPVDTAVALAAWVILVGLPTGWIVARRMP
ncbi:MAG: hypothetical protein ACT4N8_07395 [Sphingosinicella sp.]|uniref:hypothetical protein n=1 Tax=Sphingosinicella sp. TaxID=1917971 RepID=UPI0040376018